MFNMLGEMECRLDNILEFKLKKRQWQSKFLFNMMVLMIILELILSKKSSVDCGHYNLIHA